MTISENYSKMKFLQTRNKIKLYDAIQHAWVWTCIGVTLVGSGYIGYEFFLYFTKVRPIKKELEQRYKEELLKEGRMMKDLPEVPHSP